MHANHQLYVLPHVMKDMTSSNCLIVHTFNIYIAVLLQGLSGVTLSVEHSLSLTAISTLLMVSSIVMSSVTILCPVFRFN